MSMEVDGMRKKGRSELRWSEKVANDMREKGLRERDTQDRGDWYEDLQVTAISYRNGLNADKEEDPGSN